jgi:hypothetical protein
MNLDQIQQLIKSLANNEKIAVSPLAVKLARCVEANPHDQTFGMISRVIDKMEDNKIHFMTKADFKDLYNKFYSRGTKFAEAFEDELDIKKPVEDTNKVKDDGSVVDLSNCADPVLANALASIFNKEELKVYSKDLGNKAIKLVAQVLDSWNMKPANVAIDNGNEKLLVVRADYDTPKGITSFFVPIEINKNKLAEASVFVGNSGPIELNNVNIKSYIQSFAGNRLNIKASTLLEVITKSASEINPVELAIAKLNVSRSEQSDFFHNQIVGQKIVEAGIKDVEIQKSNEFESFEKQFTSVSGLAAYNFGEAVKIASNMISRNLKSFGYNSQIAVSDSNKDTIFYSVAINDVAFTVPVKISNGKIINPEVIICNGTISAFDKQSIDKIHINNEVNYKTAACASPQFELTTGDIINNIRVAISEHNFAKAEDALNVLAQKDNNAYKTGLVVYMNGLAGNKKAESKCNFITKNASSVHPICGHTGLPLHKVYQDKHGNCLPLYRRNMDESYDGAFYMTAKILG